MRLLQPMPAGLLDDGACIKGTTGPHSMAKTFTIRKVSKDTAPPSDPQRPEAEVFFRYFDPDFYLAQLPDDLDIINAAEHYLFEGWRNGFDPSPDFSTDEYLLHYPDVRAAGMNPLEHYARFGVREGRQPRPSHVYPGLRRGPGLAEQPFPEDAPPDDALALDLAGDEPADGLYEAEAVIAIAAEPAPPAIDPGVLSAVQSHMDTPYYRYQLRDTAAGGEELARHYILEGWKRGLDPTTGFSTRYYLEANPDVEAAGVNPFYHYVVAGQAEGRFPKHPGGDRITRLLHVQPLETVVRHWRGIGKPEAGLTAAKLAARLKKGADRLLIAFCHDNYRANSGGVQLCLQLEEELAATEHGGQYLGVYPAQPIPRLAHRNEGRDNLVNVVLAGEQLGCCRMSDVIEAVGKYKTRNRDVALVIHHFLGHSPEQIMELAATAGARSCAVWVHDYFTLCPSYALQRNSISYCGAPPPASNECALCLYGEERLTHLKRLGKFFKAVPVDLLSPSQAALDLWNARSQLPVKSKSVVPHMELVWKARKESPPAPERNRPVRVAFLGTITPIKGWPVFESLVQRLSYEGHYEFLAFGVQPPPDPNVKLVPVHVTADDRNAMVRAIAKADVDIVLHWAGWPETFSFSTFEAIAGGAFVVTNPQSGNVAVAVRNLKSGIVLDNEAELIDYFVSGKVKALAKQARKRRAAQSCRTRLSAMALPHVYGSAE